MTTATTRALTPTAIALGNFDGIHRGHQQVFQPILNPSGDGEKTYATVVTFNPHPKEFFTGQPQQLLTPLNEKIAPLEHCGIEQLILLPFNETIAQLSPQAFVEQILIEQLQAKKISIGADFRFGHRRSGTAEDLKAIAQQYNRQVHITPLYTQGEERISSSRIRQALQQGDIPQANYLLGRKYTLQGQVITGQKLGRTIGFPTANLQLTPEKFLPRYGVYSVRVHIEINNQETKEHIGVMNIGCRPTVEDHQHPTIEVHLLDWSGDLYGKTLTVELEAFLRPEQKFSSLDALKAQITQDCQTAKDHLTVRLSS